MDGKLLNIIEKMEAIGNNGKPRIVNIDKSGANSSAIFYSGQPIEIIAPKGYWSDRSSL